MVGPDSFMFEAFVKPCIERLDNLPPAALLFPSLLLWLASSDFSRIILSQGVLFNAGWNR